MIYVKMLTNLRVLGSTTIRIPLSELFVYPEVGTANPLVFHWKGGLWNIYATGDSGWIWPTKMRIRAWFAVPHLFSL